jgi:predicted nuclease with TOPRIM domain
MAVNKPSTGRTTEPSIQTVLLKLAEVVALSEKLQDENNHLKIEWGQAFLRLKQNNTTIRMLSEQKDRLENENDKLITKNNTLEAQQRSCPHKH